MHIDPEDLATSYAKMGEVELMELAQAYDSLTDSAQRTLQAEFARRKLEPPIIEDAEDEEEPRNLVTVRRYRDLSEAIVARSLLESAGIYVFLRDENLVRLDWQVSNFIGGIRLQVAANDQASAPPQSWATSACSGPLPRQPISAARSASTRLTR